MKFVNILKDTIKSLDFKIARIMKMGIRVSFLLILFSCYILITYQITNTLNLFYIGLSLFKTALCFVIAFFIFGISFNTIKKEIG